MDLCNLQTWSKFGPHVPIRMLSMIPYKNADNVFCLSVRVIRTKAVPGDAYSVVETTISSVLSAADGYGPIAPLVTI